MSPKGLPGAMVAMGSEPPAEIPPSVTPMVPEAHRQTRYNYLVGRLRSRQITMEEATELFALMQALLRAAEASRRTPSAPPARPGGAIAPAVPGPTPPSASSASDDLFLAGLLAMGAGAGLLAAMARRLAEGAPPPTDPGRGSAARRDG